MAKNRRDRQIGWACATSSLSYTNSAGTKCSAAISRRSWREFGTDRLPSGTALARLLGGLVFTVDGYDDDAREIFEWDRAQVGVLTVDVRGTVAGRLHPDLFRDSRIRQGRGKTVAQGVERALGKVPSALALHYHEIESGTLHHPLEAFAEAVFSPRTPTEKRRAKRSVGNRGADVVEVGEDS